MLVRLIPLLLLAVSTRCSAMILYQIEPSQPEYLLQQQIDLSLRIENQGETSVELPCPDWAENSVPIFAISGPGFAQAQQFSNWSSPSSWSRPYRGARARQTDDARSL